MATKLTRVKHLVLQAKEAHVKARNFAEINHKHLAAEWRRHRNDLLAAARTIRG